MDTTLTVLLVIIVSVPIFFAPVSFEKYFVYPSTNTTTITNTTTTNDYGFNFSAVGDWACRNPTIATVNNILDKSPELILGLGDFSYNNTADCWLQIVDPIDENMRIVIGNHDVLPSALLQQYMSQSYKTILFF
jgi:hypothetical protein